MTKRLLGIAVAMALSTASGAAVAETQQTSPATAATSAPNYTQSMERLQQAAQRLREAVQAMAQQPAGPGRDEAMDAARDALFDTQQAMVQLPPELRTGESPGIDRTRAMEELQEAAQRLREAIQAMAQQPAGPGRDKAIEEAHQAILESQQAMLSLPPDLRIEK